MSDPETELGKWGMTRGEAIRWVAAEVLKRCANRYLNPESYTNGSVADADMRIEQNLAIDEAAAIVSEELSPYFGHVHR